MIDAKNNVRIGPAGGVVCRTRRCRCSYSPPSPTPSSSHSRHTPLLSMPLFQPVTRCAAFLDHFDLNPPPLPSCSPLHLLCLSHFKLHCAIRLIDTDNYLLHNLCNILVPISRVIVVLPLISSLTTVHESPRGAWLDSRPAFVRTPHCRLFTLLSTDLSVKSGKSGGEHEGSAG